MQCDYEMLGLLARKLQAVFPDKEKSYACFNALLPLDVNPGNTSLKLTTRAERKPSCREKIRWTCTHAGFSLPEHEWERYISAPLDYLVTRDGLVARVIKDGELAFRFFLGSPEDADDSAAWTFIDTLGEAYQHDLGLCGLEDDGRVENAQKTAELYLGELLLCREKPEKRSAAARTLLGYLLDWALGGTKGQSDWIKKQTIIPSPGPTPAPTPSDEADEGLVVSISQGSMHNVLGMTDIDPQRYGAVGFGHAFRTGTRATHVKLNQSTLAPLVSGVFNLPAVGSTGTSNGGHRFPSTVSRQHAVLNNEDGAWRLYDLDASNGTVIRRRLKGGDFGFYIVGTGRRYADLHDMAASVQNPTLLKSVENTMVLPQGTGCAVREDDYIYLGYQIVKQGKSAQVEPTEGTIILHVLPS